MKKKKKNRIIPNQLINNVAENIFLLNTVLLRKTLKEV